MKKLFDIMQKYGLEYQKIDLGYNYFFGAPAISADGAHIYLESGGCCRPEWRRFQRYCDRYGYTLKPWGAYPGYTVYSVCRADDAARLALYADYRAKSVKACDEAINLRHQGYYSGYSDLDFNEYLKGIMQFYEDEYMNALKQAEAA